MTHLEILLKAYDDIGIKYQIEKKVFGNIIAMNSDRAYTYVRFRGDYGRLSKSFIEFDPDGSIASY